jgi:phospholipase C
MVGGQSLILYYDEHGGFYDDVPPPAMDYTTTDPNDDHPFSSLGVRIPTVLISPWVSRGSTTHLLFDHTSVLQLLAEKFTPNIPYSANVDYRKNHGVSSISAVLTDQPDTTIPAISNAPIPN